MTAPAKNRDLHGNVPDRCAVAIVLVDVINDFEFAGAVSLFRNAVKAVRPIADLKKRAAALGIPVIYVNDNFGQWRSDFRKLLTHTLRAGVRGRKIAAALKPGARDYFVLKPTYSAFHSTTLDLLLEYLGTRTVILGGFAGNSCVLFSANDAFLRDLQLFVPRDCIASESAAANRAALKHIATVLKADIRPADRIDLAALRDERLQRAP